MLFTGGIALGFLLAFTLIQDKDAPITSNMIKDAASVIGLEFTQAERDTMIDALEDTREDLQAIRDMKIDNSIPLLSISILSPLVNDLIISREHKHGIFLKM